MKILTYRTIRPILLFLLIVTQYSCNTNSYSIDLLTQAQNIMEGETEKALALLDSIREPETMDKDHYMQYAVAHVQAKYKLYRGVSNDTLIFEAQKYFDSRNDAYNAMLAHFYAGGVWNDREMREKMMECLFHAEYYAKKMGNKAWNGRIQNNIADLYFERDMMDSAIVRYHYALDYYKNEEGYDRYKINMHNSLGVAFEDIGKLDSAYVYYNKGLDLAKKVNSQYDQAMITHNLGLIYRKQGNYDKAADNLHKALAQTTNAEDSLKSYLCLSKLYSEKHQIDSAKYYNNQVTERIAEVTDNRTLKYAYGSLSDYNRQIGNYKEAFRYSDLKEEANKKIIESSNTEKLLSISSKYQLSLKDKDMETQRARLYMCIFAILLAALAGFFITRNIRKRQQVAEQNKLLQLECELLNKKVNNLTFMQDIYRNVVTEWRTIDKEVNKLVEEYGAKDKPEIFKRVEQVMNSLRENTNSQLVEWAKDYLRTLPSGDNAVGMLKDKELLFFMVCYCKYTTKDMAFILGVVPLKYNLDLRRLDLKGKLKAAGIADNHINEIVFAEAKV